MPKFAATILGFVLSACSIGFNTARYPVVWEAVCPARANESARPAVTSQPEKPARLAAQRPVSPSSQPTKPIEVKPAPKVADKSAVNNRVAVAAAPRGEDAPAAPRPLVPVIPVSASNAPEDKAAGGAGIRRLPPVERPDPNFPNSGLARPCNGSIPVYPTTGIE